MSGLDLMKERVKYTGYDSADGRNVSGKYRSFQAALKNSYQAEQITTLDQDNDFNPIEKQRCLINPSRLTEQFDKKVISIDFDSGMQEGSVFYQDRTGKYWIVNLQQHTEEAYFRGTITRADYKTEVDGHPYIVSLRGPVETETIWNQKHGITWNDLNYSMVMDITKDNRTINYFSRHQVIKLPLRYQNVDKQEQEEEEHNQKVVATDKYSEERIMQVYLNEWYDNEAEDNMVPEEEEIPDTAAPYIGGPANCHVYDENLTFSIVGLTNGAFLVNSSKVKIVSADDKTCVLDILAGKSFSFILSYKDDSGVVVEKNINVKSF